MSFDSKRFEDTPFGDYDNTPGTERFPDGWYDGTVVEVKNAGDLDDKKKVKILVALDDLPTVQRKMGVAWGSKDGEPAAWVKFISHALRKPIGDPVLRAATPKTVRGKRLAFLMQWSGRGYMDIIDFNTEGHTGALGPRRTQRGGQLGRTQRRDEQPPAPGAERGNTQRTAGATRPATGGTASLRVVRNNGGGAAATGLTPGQLRCLNVGAMVNVDEAGVRAFIRERFNLELEDVADGDVARITAEIRNSFAVSA